MTWLASIIRAILDWLTAEVKKDTKASDADDTPKEIKDKWRERIKEMEKEPEPSPAPPAEPANYVLPSTRRKIEKREKQK